MSSHFYTLVNLHLGKGTLYTLDRTRWGPELA